MDIIAILESLINRIGLPIAVIIILFYIAVKIISLTSNIFRSFIETIKSLGDNFRISVEKLVTRVETMDQEEISHMKTVELKLQKIEDMQINLDNENQRLKDLIRTSTGQTIIREETSSVNISETNTNVPTPL